METETSFRLNFVPLYKLTLFVLVLHFAFNFAASPWVLQTYILLCVLIFMGVVFCDLKDSLSLIFIHFFIEGQGRIVFGYNPFARIMFDLIVCVFILKYIVQNRRIFPLEGVPRFLKFVIMGHMLVFVFELFNNKGAGFWVNFPMIKVYILPFIEFFLFLNFDFDIRSEQFSRIIKTIMFVIVLNGILCIKQFYGNTPMMVEISKYYVEIGKLERFSNLTFRPYGTSFVPGGMSTYLYLLLGLFFLAPMNLLWIAVGLSICVVILILSQVRTAMIQYLLLFLSFAYFNFNFREKTKRRVTRYVVLVSFLFTFLTVFFFVIESNPNKKLVDLTLHRSSTIFDTEALSRARVGFFDVSRIILDKLSDNIIGLGPGRTHVITEQMGQVIDADPVYNLNYGWNYDNLWVTIAIEFGVLGIFYALCILVLPVYLFSMALDAYRRRKIEELRVIFFSLATVSTIILANWGGVGIPYNPVSFMFWFWAALGLRTHALMTNESYGLTQTEVQLTPTS